MAGLLFDKGFTIENIAFVSLTYISISLINLAEPSFFNAAVNIANEFLDIASITSTSICFA